MQRYFIKSDQLVNDQVTITGNDVHHIRDVMRTSVGDHIICCTTDKLTYLVEVTNLDKTEVHARVVETKEENVELPILVTIAQGIMKGDKFDLVVQKATECGASAFVPVAMKRSVAKIDAKKVDKKASRWQKIALEAARQSHRQVVPTLEPPVDMKGLVALAADYDVCLFAYEAHGEDSHYALANVLASAWAGMRVLVLIGPEGGIDETEVAVLIESGFRAVGLGPRILRTETAPIYVMSAISYAMELSR